MGWPEFVACLLIYPARMTYFGLASCRSIRNVAIEREHRTRMCRECGMPLNVYNSLRDHEGNPAMFLFDNRIRAFREDMAVHVCRLADASLTEMDIPVSTRYLGFDWTVTSVGSKAFMGCGSITSVMSAVDVGYKSFANCGGIASVVLDGAGSVGDMPSSDARPWRPRISARSRLSGRARSAAAGRWPTWTSAASHPSGSTRSTAAP